MKPIEFPEQNKTYTKPERMTDEECSSLPTFQNHEQIISCWEISDEELETLKQTKKVWFRIWSPVQFPILLEVSSPFAEPIRRCDFCEKRFGKNQNVLGQQGIKGLFCGNECLDNFLKRNLS